METSDVEIYNKLRNDIINNNVVPAVKHEFTEYIKWRDIWHKISILNFTLSQVMTGIAAILSFISAKLDNWVLALISGSISILAFVFIGFGQFSNTQYEARTKDINKYMEILHIQMSMPLNERNINNTEINGFTNLNSSETMLNNTPRNTICVRSNVNDNINI